MIARFRRGEIIQGTDPWHDGPLSRGNKRVQKIMPRLEVLQVSLRHAGIGRRPGAGLLSLRVIRKVFWMATKHFTAERIALVLRQAESSTSVAEAWINQPATKPQVRTLKLPRDSQIVSQVSQSR